MMFASCSDGALFSNITTWEPITPTFPSGTSDTQYTHVYKNKATKEVFVQLYATYPNGLVSAGSLILGGLPIPLNASLNAMCLDYSNGVIVPFFAYMANGQLLARSALEANHSLFATITYVAMD